MSYLGRSGKLSQKAQEKVSFLATNGQTSKTGLSYVPTFVEVYVNGILLTDTTDFTAVNGSSITFTVALALNDEVTVISLKTFSVSDHYTKSDANTLLAAKAKLTKSTTAPSSPAVGDQWFNTATAAVSGIAKKALAVYNGTAWQTATTGIPFTATGGTITTSGLYTIHTFTSSGTFTPAFAGTVDYLVVAGGAGGARNGAGGGGAGGLLTATGFSVAGTGLTVTIGAGGAAGNSHPQRGFNGANSVFSSITATGGGGGGSGTANAVLGTGADGGSGGGGGGNDTGAFRSGGSGVGGQGNNGGTGYSSAGAAGGGGAGAAGGNGSSSPNNGGTGGAGLANSYSGSSVTYAGGGGGAGQSNSEAGGAGGAGGGGRGGGSGGNSVAGTANTGSGGGGGSGTGGSNGSAGGSGIVIVRYLT